MFKNISTSKVKVNLIPYVLAFGGNVELIN